MVPGANFERLERRDVPAAIDFGMAIGLGASGNYADIRANAIANDAAGNLLVAGSFAASAGFDPNAPASITAASGSRDLFVARYTPTGTLAWARTFPGQSAQAVAQGSALAVDRSGNVFVSGTFSGTVDFDPGPGVSTLSSPGRTDAFVLKLDGEGRFAWARPMAESPGNTATSPAIAPDGSGGVYVGGSFQESLTLGASTLAAGGLSEAFVARLDGSGQFRWAVATRGSGTSVAEARGLAVDAAGNVFAAGFLAGTLDFDPGPGVVAVASNGSYDAALWKVSPAGQLLWARGIGGLDFDQANAVAVDPPGNAYVAGTFSLAADFGTSGRADILTAGGYSDVFVTKVAGDGSEVWSRSLVGSPNSFSQGRGIAVDAGGRVHVAGSFQGTVDFDPGPGVSSLASVGYSDAFVAGLAGDGSAIYALRAGRSGSAAALGVTVDASGFASIAGPYSGASFGTTALPTVGASRFFVARVASGMAPPAAPALQAGSDTGASAADRITATTAPRFDVVASSPASAIRLLRDGVVVATRVGSGAVIDPGPVADGPRAYSAIEVGPSGLASVAGAATTITIDTRPPAAPPAPALLAADDTGAQGDRMTTVRRPRVTGTAEPLATVSWIAPDGSVFASTTASASGAYTLASAKALSNGTYNIRVRATDAAGNVGAIGASFFLTIRATAGDLDGDGKSDPLVFRSSRATFVGQYSATGRALNQVLGQAGDVPALADYDGDGKADLAVFRPSTGDFIVTRSSTGATTTQNWGIAGDIPVPGDYDGDGKADLAIFRPSNGTFYVLNSSNGTPYVRGWGTMGDVPISADYDGDGKADIAVLRPSEGIFYVIPSSTGIGYLRAWAMWGDVAVPGDYDGDGKADLAMFRPSNATFYVLPSSTGVAYAQGWGAAGDVPAVADHDGDGRDDVAIFRPSDASFYVLKSATHALGVVSVGSAIDRPAVAPIPYWFAIAGSGAMQAASPMVAPTPAVATGTSARGASGRSLDRAFQSLDLERWRVGV